MKEKKLKEEMGIVYPLKKNKGVKFETQRQKGVATRLRPSNVDHLQQYIVPNLRSNARERRRSKY